MAKKPPSHRAGPRKLSPYSKNEKKANTMLCSGHSTPQSYAGATFTLLTKGNKSNGTHWQLTAKCTGCTSWTGSSGVTRIDPRDSKRLGYACSASKPSSPGSNSSSIPVHDVYNYITHDFSAGANANFEALLAKNGITVVGNGNATVG
jgi:hypothetical protein